MPVPRCAQTSHQDLPSRLREERFVLMKIAREWLLALVLVISVGATSAFVAPVGSGLSIRPREKGGRKGLASSAPAAAAAAVEQEVLDFAIVGGGPAGLAAAVGLKEKGLNVKVFEGELGERP